RLHGAGQVLKLWQRYSGWPQVSEVRPEPAGGFLVYPERTAMVIRFPEDVYPEQFARLSAVFDLWRGRESPVAGVDLSVPGQAVLRLRRAGGGDSKGGRVKV